MTHALLAILSVVAAVVSFVALACASALIGAEAMSRAHRVAAWLVRRAARRLPTADREANLALWMAELSSPELAGEPLSQIAFGMRVLVRSYATARAMGKPSVPTRVGTLLARLGGGDVTAVDLLSSERSMFAARGAMILYSGFLTSVVFSWTAHVWLGMSFAIVLPLGIAWMVATMTLDRMGLPLRRWSSRRATVAWAVPRLLIDVVVGLLTAQLLLLLTLHNVLAAQAALAGDRHPGMLHAAVLLHAQTAGHPALLTFQVMLTVLTVVTLTLPTLVALGPSMRWVLARR